MAVFEARVGCTLWLDGSVWTVDEISGSRATIHAGSTFRQVSLKALSSAVSLDFDSTSPEGTPSSEQWTAATPSQRERAEQKADVVRRVVRDGESAAAFEDAAKATHVSTRTLRRWVAKYREGGVANLIDTRNQGPRPTGAVDPRWDKACLDVLSGYTQASTPTRDVVLDQTRRVLEERFPDEQVPVPARATAYRRLSALRLPESARPPGRP